MATPPDPSQLLSQGIAAARAVDPARARHLLIPALRYHANNDQTWLWLSGVSDEPAEQRRCLQRALAINPHNVHAQRGLAALTLEPITASDSFEPLQWPPRRA